MGTYFSVKFESCFLIKYCFFGLYINWCRLIYNIVFLWQYLSKQEIMNKKSLYDNLLIYCYKTEIVSFPWLNYLNIVVLFLIKICCVCTLAWFCSCYLNVLFPNLITTNAKNCIIQFCNCSPYHIEYNIFFKNFQHNLF